MSTKTFNIIIPVYNVAPYLRECLDSVLAQAFGDWEAICVDDGSTDSSGAILDEYAAKDNRFRVIHKANGGVSSARNAGLDAARGEWICFLDGDDVLKVVALQKINDMITRSPEVDIIKTGLMQFCEGQRVVWSEGEEHECTFTTDCDLPIPVLDGWFCQRCYKAALVTEIRFPPLRNGEDTVFMAQCICKAKRIIVSDCKLYGYRQRANSASRSKPSLPYVRQIMGYTYQTLSEYDKSSKKVDPCFLRIICNTATEELVSCIEQLPKSEISAAYCEAFEFWKRVMRLRILPNVQRIRLVIAVAITLRIVTIILFGLPKKLKEKGIHR